MLISTTPPIFYRYVEPVFFDEIDGVEYQAYTQAHALEHHIHEALLAALHIDEYQTAHGSVPGTSGEDPFNVLRQAIAAAEKKDQCPQ